MAAGNPTLVCPLSFHNYYLLNPVSSSFYAPEPSFFQIYKSFPKKFLSVQYSRQLKLPNRKRQRNLYPSDLFLVDLFR
ncbi:hypothetical protein CCACVL1_14109 [Corchorus capsularis]|uniref:Uncharacterized protein n=1 Tax=Corchorus capsularis TaxID=210143 RepID=A0A1R3I869_COCAP|nr:hypothetical protein CCACVL1_14109 [Corchorus capsularis]